MSLKLSELLAAKAAKKNQEHNPDNDIESYRTILVKDAHGHEKEITLNDNQLEAIRLALTGASFVLLGSAGTGKTTCTKALISALMNTGKVNSITDMTHKYLKAGNPSILITSYTRRATSVIRRAMPPDLSDNTITIHKALEYAPVFYEEYNPETGQTRKKRIFEPSRTAINKLCPRINLVIIDESSMLDYALHEKLISALNNNIQIIYIGDLNQIPPVFGHAILGYKILSLPVIELTEVYRQALESPIIKLAHRILSGNTLPSLEFNKYQEKGKLQFITMPRKDPESALYEVVKLFNNAIDSGTYDPENNIILCPQDVQKPDSPRVFNNTNINKHIATKLAKNRDAIVHEVIINFNKAYYSVGDYVIYDKMDCIVTNIDINPLYIGIDFQEPSTTLDYFGHNSDHAVKIHKNTDINIDNILNKLENLGNIEENELKGREASHIITLRLEETGEEITISKVGELMNLNLGYAMTIHKAQGSEWKKVFLLLHGSHNFMLKRELLYTAVTRASEQLIIVCEQDSFIKGIKQQAIKGDTLAEKAEFFKGRIPASSSST